MAAICGVAAIPPACLVLIGLMIRVAVVTAYRHSIFNEFGRRIVYMDKMWVTPVLLMVSMLKKEDLRSLCSQTVLTTDDENLSMMAGIEYIPEIM